MDGEEASSGGQVEDWSGLERERREEVQEGGLTGRHPKSPEDVIRIVEGLERPPFVEDLRNVLKEALRDQVPTNARGLAELWKMKRLSYLYESNPRVLGIRSEDHASIQTYTLLLLVFCFECQPSRKLPGEVKIRIDKSTWAFLKGKVGTGHLASENAFAFVAASFLLPGLASAPKRLDVRHKRALSRAHLPPFYGYALNLEESQKAAVSRERRKRARKLLEEAEALRSLESLDELDRTLREYRKIRASLRDSGVLLSGQISASFAVDARKRFEQVKGGT